MERPCYVHASQVAFGDTDCSGWLHFPQIFRHVEEAEHAFLRERGILVFDRELGGWPRVHVSCDFKSPLRFGDAIEIQLGIERIGTSALHWVFEIWKAGQCCAAGKLTTVRVDGRGQPAAIDDATRARLV